MIMVPPTQYHGNKVGSGGERPPAEFFLIIGTARGATTSVANTFGSHACSTSWNENVMLGQGDHFSQGLPASEHNCVQALPCNVSSGGCNGTRWKRRMDNLVEVLQEARHGWCTRDHIAYPDESPWRSCGGRCVVAIKLHHNHLMRTSVSPKTKPKAYRHAIEKLMAHRGTAVVIVERHDLDAQYCSFMYSKATGIWHGGDRGVKDQWARTHCQGGAPAEFKREKRDYYSWARSTLRALNKSYLDMSFEAFVSDVRGWQARMHTFTGLPVPAQQYNHSCHHGCNCPDNWP